MVPLVLIGTFINKPSTKNIPAHIIEFKSAIFLPAFSEVFPYFFTYKMGNTK